MSNILEIKNLCKSFESGDEKLHVLANLNLEVGLGQMIAVTGASGCGKSTFLHLVGGMERPDKGKIVLEGTEMTDLTSRELAKLRNEKIGFIFQFHHLLPEFSALENVMFPLLLRRVNFKQAEKKARDLLNEVGLSQRTTHKPGELSGGEQQRVAVARALVGEPRLLLGDEPTGNLDEQTSEKINELLLKVHQHYQLTSIIVTHNTNLASLCNSERRLQAGRLG